MLAAAVRPPSTSIGRIMIIDCHGHYTTAPKALQDYRDSQIAGLKDAAHAPQKANVKISDDQIRESLENAQLKLQRARGTDLTIFSPRASIATSVSMRLARVSGVFAVCTRHNTA